ncbi:RBBP9/YdeN family alpha/beta hydrolase [Nocardia araoensis]|uniref:RBBP9/YdeN family alpha/beta hydrolase n=1 Tax=Nocardia araoensis TaxID=228600 RepID=UPI0003035B1A|nr:alpha/beta fold hydrolase [Nocardia araoensis]
MSTIIVSHGYNAAGDSVWFPYLSAELTALGHTVVVPNLPDPSAPRLDPWRKTLAVAASEAGPARDTVVIGHSLGGVNVLRMLEQHDPDAHGRFAGAVLVSTAAHEVGYAELAEFFEQPFDWDRIRNAANEFRVLSAIDDPVNIPDPVEHVGLLVRNLGATAVVLPGGRHLGDYPEDHIELPEAVRLVTDILAAGA